MPASTASASESLSEYPIATGYTDPLKPVSSGGSLWYVEHASSGNTPTLANMTTSGATTSYSMVPSGYTSYGGYFGSLTADTSSNVWFAGCSETSSGNPEVELGYITPSTDAITTFEESSLPCVGSFGAGTYVPFSVTADASGNIWLQLRFTGTTANYELEEFSPSNTLLSTYYVSGRTQPWSSLIAGPDDSLWATDYTDGQIDQLTLSSTTDTITGMNTFTTPNSPGGITVGPDGNLWFTESGATIGVMTPGGTFTNSYTIPSGDDGGAIVTGPDGALWFTATPSTGSTDSIGRITTSGSVTEYAVPTSNPGLNGIVVGPDNALWFTEGLGEKVGRIGY